MLFRSSNYAWRTIFQSARTVIFEVNEHYPRLQGVDGSHRVHLSEADFVVEGVHEPLPQRSYREPSTTDIEIARRVVELIPDGAIDSIFSPGRRCPSKKSVRTLPVRAIFLLTGRLPGRDVPLAVNLTASGIKPATRIRSG